MNLWLIFLTGLSIGGLSCLAIQGGLLACTIATGEGQGKKALLSTLTFLITKLIAYTILGYFLGALGSQLSISENVRIGMQVVVGIYLLGIACNLLRLHPVFRYFVIQPPKIILKFAENSSEGKTFFAPAILGLLTIFIPCGTTLAIEALAISSGSATSGALTMFVFTIATFPIFLGIGLLTAGFKNLFQKNFAKLTAVMLIYLGLTSINGALILSGLPYVEIDLSGPRSEIAATPIINGVQVADIGVYSSSYTPNYLQVKSGIPVQLNLTTHGGLGCTSQFKIPQLGITKNLPLSGTDSLVFTPQTTGKLTWTCSMGMYYGIIEVT